MKNNRCNNIKTDDMCTTDKREEYIYIIKTTCFNDTVEVAETSRGAVYKAFKKCKAAGYDYTWLEFQKIVTSTKRVKSKDLEC